MKDHNPLWEFAVKIYFRKGVSEILLQAQDHFSLDINMILYSAWLASENRRLSTKNVSEVENLVALWRREVIEPLRGLRISFKAISGADLIREDVKKIEVRAEKEQLRIMYNSFLETSSADPNELKENLLDSNLRSLSAIGFEDESMLVRIKNVLAEKMDWHIS